MRLIREPRFDTITCRCGTIFQPETGDFLSYKFNDNCPWEIEQIWTRCPTCGSSQEVIVIGKYDLTCSEKGGE